MTPPTLSSLNMRQLVALLKDLSGGQIGFDPFRDPRTASKQALLTHIATKFDTDATVAAVKRLFQANAQAAIKDAPAPYAPAVMTPADQAAIIANLKDPEPAPKGPAATPGAIDAATAAEAIAGILASLAPKQTVDAEQVRKIVKDELQNIKPQYIVIEQAGKPAVEIKEHVNPAFQEIIAVAAHYPNIMLVGPAGCGKTHLAKQVATALGKSFATISGSAGISESHFTGRLLPTGAGGKFEYTESPFISEYSKADGCFLIDEFDALDPNCLMIIQGATANGGFTVESRVAAGKEAHVHRGKGALLLASANTYGTGADALYVGRFQQDAAANDRWYFIPVDYDQELEAKLAPAEICAWVWKLRAKVAEYKLRRVVSTRMLQKAAAAHAAKRTMPEIRERLLAGWTKEERQKCGV